MTVHDLLRSGQLQAAVSSVLNNQATDDRNLNFLLGKLRDGTSSSDVHESANLLAHFMLATGDLVAAHLAYSIALPESQAHRAIETARVVSVPTDSFPFETVTEAGQSEFALEPLLVDWSATRQILAEQRRVPLRVARLDSGQVFGLTFLPVTADGRTCLNWYTHNPNNPNKIAMAEDDSAIPLICSNAILGSFEGVDEYRVGVLIGNSENFGHWLLNHLARLALTSCVSSLKGVPLVIGENITPGQLECLNRMGYPEPMLIRLRKGRLARFHTL